MFKSKLFFNKKNTYSSIERICILILSNISSVDKNNDKNSLVIDIENDKSIIEENGFYVKKDFKKVYRLKIHLSIKGALFVESKNFLNIYFDIREDELTLKDIDSIKTQILSQNLNVISETSINATLNIFNRLIKKRKLRDFGSKLFIEENENIIKKNKIYRKALQAKSYFDFIPFIQNKLEFKCDFYKGKIKKEIMIQIQYPKSNKHYNLGFLFPIGINPFVDFFENKDFFKRMYNKILLKEIGIEIDDGDFTNLKRCRKKIEQVINIQTY